MIKKIKTYFNLIIFCVISAATGYFIYIESQPKNPFLLSYWPKFENKRILDKIQAHPIYHEKIKIKNDKGELVNLIPHNPNSDLLNEFKSAIKQIPREVTKVVNRRLIGIFLTENLASTGAANKVLDAHNKPYYIILINTNKIKFSTNDWVTKRVRSAFPQHLAKLIQVTIDKPKVNNTLLAILIHEFAHIYAWEKGIVPMDYSFNALNQQYDFMNESWDYNGYGKAFYKYKSDEIFSSLEYYSPISNERDILRPSSYYKQLKESSFTSLYSTYDYQEDFAEAFFLYHWLKIYQRPYIVTIENKDKVLQYNIGKKFLNSRKFNKIERVLK